MNMKTINEFLQEFKDYYNKVGYEGRVAIIEGVLNEVIDDSIRLRDFTPMFQILAMTKEQIKLMHKLSGKLKLAIVAEYKLHVKFTRLITTIQGTISEKADAEREEIREKILTGELEYESAIFQFAEEKLAELMDVDKYKTVKHEIYDIIYNQYLKIWQEEKQKLNAPAEPESRD